MYLYFVFSRTNLFQLVNKPIQTNVIKCVRVTRQKKRCYHCKLLESNRNFTIVFFLIERLHLTFVFCCSSICYMVFTSSTSRVFVRFSLLTYRDRQKKYTISLTSPTFEYITCHKSTTQSK